MTKCNATKSSLRHLRVAVAVQLSMVWKKTIEGRVCFTIFPPQVCLSRETSKFNRSGSDLHPNLLHVDSRE